MIPLFNLINESDIVVVDVSQVQPYSFETYELDSMVESADMYCGSGSEPADAEELLIVELDFDCLQNKRVVSWDYL